MHRFISDIFSEKFVFLAMADQDDMMTLKNNPSETDDFATKQDGVFVPSQNFGRLGWPSQSTSEKLGDISEKCLF